MLDSQRSSISDIPPFYPHPSVNLLIWATVCLYTHWSTQLSLWLSVSLFAHSAASLFARPVACLLVYSHVSLLAKYPPVCPAPSPPTRPTQIGHIAGPSVVHPPVPWFVVSSLGTVWRHSSRSTEGSGNEEGRGSVEGNWSVFFGSVCSFESTEVISEMGVISVTEVVRQWEW